MRDAADQRVPMTDASPITADLTAEAIPDEAAIEATKQATADVQSFSDFAVHPDIVSALAAHGITASMSRTGNCYRQRRRGRVLLDAHGRRQRRGD